MSFVDEQDQKVYNSLKLLEMLNPDMDRIQIARIAILASNGNVNDAVVLLRKDAIQHVVTKGLCAPLDDAFPSLVWRPSSKFARVDPSRLYYKSTFQLECLVRSALATCPEFAPSFPQFKKLPAEIRTKIWALALPRHRNLFIKPYSNAYRQCAPPALLSVNRESRYIAQGVFRLCILHTSPSSSAVYVNVNLGFDHLFIIHLVGRCQHLVEVKVRDEARVKCQGGGFRYIRNAMRVIAIMIWPIFTSGDVTRPVPWAFWEEFVYGKKLKKKVWVRSSGRLIRV